MVDADADRRRGALAAAGAYVCWGAFPLYFKAVGAIAPLELVAHRIAWSLVFLAAVLGLQRHLAWLRPALRTPRVIGSFAASACTLALNWFVFVWAVAHGHVVEASLGYFINPLVNVAVGAGVLKERLRPAQWLAVGLAAAGVVWLTWQGGRLPWIALVLALSFSAYGLQRKLAPLGTLEGLTLETLVLAPMALGALGWWIAQGQSDFVHVDASTRLLVMAAGPITAIPLLLFAYGARRISFSLLGLLQYIGPTLQLASGVFLMGESFDRTRLLGFSIIWAALGVYSVESAWQSRRATMSQ